MFILCLLQITQNKIITFHVLHKNTTTSNVNPKLFDILGIIITKVGELMEKTSVLHCICFSWPYYTYYLRNNWVTIYSDFGFRFILSFFNNAFIDSYRLVGGDAWLSHIWCKCWVDCNVLRDNRYWYSWFSGELSRRIIFRHSHWSSRRSITFKVL